MRGTALFLLFAGCLLCVATQPLPYRSAPRIVTDECPSSDDQTADRDISDALSHIAAQIANGTSESCDGAIALLIMCTFLSLHLLVNR